MRREKKDQILAVLPEKIRGILLNHGLDFEKIQEIRLREEQPLAVKKEDPAISILPYHRRYSC